MPKERTKVDWTTDEIKKLVAYWPSYGSSWDGWRDVIPNRSYNSIDRKARDIGLVRLRKPIPTTNEIPAPCPFCGHTPTVMEREDTGTGRRRWYVVCNWAKCYANTYVVSASRESAINYWNLRRTS